MEILKSFTKFDGSTDIEKDVEASKKIGKDVYRVKQGFRYYVGDRDNREWVYVPKGFLTDGATIPKWLHWLIKPWGKHGQACIVHDVLCLYPFVHGPDGTRMISFNRAHKIFREALKVTGNNSIKVFAMYWAVRIYFHIKGYEAEEVVRNKNKTLINALIREMRENANLQQA